MTRRTLAALCAAAQLGLIAAQEAEPQAGSKSSCLVQDEALTDVDHFNLCGLQAQVAPSYVARQKCLNAENLESGICSEATLPCDAWTCGAQSNTMIYAFDFATGVRCDADGDDQKEGDKQCSAEGLCEGERGEDVIVRYSKANEMGDKSGICAGKCENTDGHSVRCSLGNTIKASAEYSPLDPSDSTAGLRIIYTGSDKCLKTQSLPYKTVVEIECGNDDGVNDLELSYRDDENVVKSMASGQQSCTIGLRLKSKSGCPVMADNTFQMICIAVLLFSAAYCAVGILWNKRRGTTGFESVPHIELWRDLRDLAADGCAVATGGRRQVANPSGMHTLLDDDEDDEEGEEGGGTSI